MAYPSEYKYTKEHEWLAVEGTTGTIGITDHAQNSLGDIVFVELPKIGAELVAGKTFGTRSPEPSPPSTPALPLLPRRLTAIPTEPGW
jgi:hypothetical protein